MTDRQKRIINLIPRCSVLADVGCDHGKIGYQACKCGIADEVIFTDISFDSLQKAKNLCETKQVSNVSFVCQNGIGDINAECVVIAGMGGLEIIEILQNAKSLPKKLVLQPMRNVDQVRKYVQRYYSIEKDFIFFDKKFYNLMYLVRGRDSLTQDEIIFGKTNIREFSLDFIKYLQVELSKCDKILAKCNDKTANCRKNMIIRMLSKGEHNDR